jgi:hypothetical protein
MFQSIENFRILGFLRTTRVYLPLHRRLEVELIGFVVIVDSTVSIIL